MIRYFDSRGPDKLSNCAPIRRASALLLAITNIDGLDVYDEISQVGTSIWKGRCGAEYLADYDRSTQKAGTRFWSSSGVRFCFGSADMAFDWFRIKYECTIPLTIISSLGSLSQPQGTRLLVAANLPIYRNNNKISPK